KLRAGDGASAAKSFDAVLVVRPKSVDALLGLAEAADAIGDDTALAGWLKQAAAVQSNSTRVQLMVALHEDNDRKLQAVEEDRDALGERDQAKLDFALALAAAHTFRAGEMMARLQAAVNESPTPEYDRRLGWMELYRDHAAAAEKAFADAEQHDT